MNNSTLSTFRRVRVKRAVILLVLALLAAGCSSTVTTPPPARTGVLRLGYTTSLADAPVLAGLQMGYLNSQLGHMTLTPAVFTTNTAEAQALLHGQLDAAYLDPVTAVAVWQAAGRGLITIIAGSATGGAELIARHGITSARQLGRALVAAPAGGAQQAAFAFWLKQNRASGAGPGNITMTAAYLASAFKSGRLAAAWEPAPLDAQMAAAGGHVLLDEASLWPGGQFPTGVLVVTSTFLAAHPATVRLLLKAHLQAVRFLDSSPASARVALGRRLAATAGITMSPAVFARAFAQLKYTDDPFTEAILTEARHAAAVGLLAPVQNLNGLLDLGPLNALLKSAGQHPVIG
jgi:NitT/TauT family transport system substrate-binding protein